MQDPNPECAGTPRPDVRLGRDRRLLSPRLFNEAYAQGKRWVGRRMVLWRRDAPDGALRLGVVSSRRVGNAVKRNRARRLVREAWRRHRHLFSGTCDVVIVTRYTLPQSAQDEVVRELLELARKAGLWAGREK